MPAASPICGGSRPCRRSTTCAPAATARPTCRRSRMAAALHFDLSVPNFGMQEYMRHTEETDAVFPHAYTLRRRRDASGRCARASASTSTRSWLRSILQARLPSGKPAGRRHHVQLVAHRQVRSSYRPAVSGGSPACGRSRAALYDERPKDLPIVSPHGHTDPAWFATNEPFADPAELLIDPDHYSSAHALQPGRSARGARRSERDGRRRRARPARRSGGCFAEHYHLFRGTPSRLWLDWVFAEVFGLDVRLSRPNGRPLLRHDRRGSAAPGVPPARAVRALQHRGPRHDRVPARPARPPPRDPRSPAGTAA